VQDLGRLGLQPAIDYLGIEAHVYEDEDTRPVITGLVHLTTEQFCGRFNDLMHAEYGVKPPLLAEPYTDEEDPVYALSTLAAMLDDGVYPISNQPDMDYHDQLHAVVGYAVAEFLPRPLSRSAGNLEAAFNLGSLLGVIDTSFLSCNHSWATSVWRRVLRANNRTVDARFRDIQQRVMSTPERFNQLSIDKT
jgi:hypothetical protein